MVAAGAVFENVTAMAMPFGNRNEIAWGIQGATGVARTHRRQGRTLMLRRAVVQMRGAGREHGERPGGGCRRAFAFPIRTEFRRLR